MRRTGIRIAVCSLVLGLAAAHAQNIRTYSEDGGPGLIALGYPPPVPVASLTPVEGFRDYDSLRARLESLALQSGDLASHVVGHTQRYGREIRAYVVSDGDDVDVEGAPEPAFFINATTHAREWGVPEIATGTVEHLVANVGDGGLVRYLLDNTRLVIVPVQNVDGFLQTQRYPTRVIVGQDPTEPGEWPRDGRMRRKNMRGADEVLDTFADHLAGVDLNRNHLPYFGTSPRGSSNPNDLTFRGAAPHSEAENVAMENALALVPRTSLRLGIDLHSFAQVFFSANTGIVTLNDVQRRLIGVLINHHVASSTSEQFPNGARYFDVPDPAGQGIGTASEYFADEFLVPAWTLEIEPRNDARQYGGTPYGHGGFILPDSQAARVRDGWARTHAIAFYFMAGPPHLRRVRVSDAETGFIVRERTWVREGGERVAQQTAAGALVPGRRYRVELAFSKPMRVRDDAGQAARLPGGPTIALSPQVRLEGPAPATLTTNAAGWQQAGLRYADDAFAFEMTAPDVEGEHTLVVRVQDMAGLALDADPATPVDWSHAAWQGWDDAGGIAGDAGFTFDVAQAAAGLTVVSAPVRAAEGDWIDIVLERGVADGTGVTASACTTAVENDACWTVAPATWDADDTGQRTLRVGLHDNLMADGTRTLTIALTADAGDGRMPLGEVAVEILDNDVDGRAVVRGRGVDGLGSAAAQARFGLEEGSTLPVDIVLDGGIEHLIPESPGPACGHLVLIAPVTVHGNRASVRNVGSGDCDGLINADNRDGGPDAAVELRDLRLVGRPVEGPDHTPSLVSATADLVLRRVVLDNAEDIILGPADAFPLLRVYEGHSLTLDRVVARGLVQPRDAGIVASGETSIRASLFDGLAATAALSFADGGADIESITAIAPVDASVLSLDGDAQARIGGSLLQRDGTAPLCRGDEDPQSLGGNVAGDTSCALAAAGDVAPVSVALGEADPLTGAILPVGVAIDANDRDCGPVDLRGAPRPQTMGEGVPRCDAGAVELGVNPYRGLWIPDRPGHGLDIQAAGRRLFLTWYTYAEDRTPTVYLALADLTGPLWQAELLASRRTAGGGFENVPVGEVQLQFASDSAATLRWKLGDAQDWSEEDLNAYLFADGEPRVEVTGTWYAPAEPGHGITVTRRGETTVAVLYYHDAEGNLRWALGQSHAGDFVEIPVSGFTGFCPDCNVLTNPVQSQPIGAVRLQFLTPERARLDVDVTYPGEQGGRFVRDDLHIAPLGDPVDNRAAVRDAQDG